MPLRTKLAKQGLIQSKSKDFSNDKAGDEHVVSHPFSDGYGKFWNRNTGT
jgi:hypothetical protein